MVVLLVLLTSLGEHLIVPSDKATLLTGSSYMEQHSFTDGGLLSTSLRSIMGRPQRGALWLIQGVGTVAL